MVVYYEDSGSGSNTPSLSVNPVSIAFGDNAINGSYEETFTVTYANLTEDLAVSVGSGLTGVSVNPTTIDHTLTSPQTVTVTYAPTAEGSISGDILVSNTDDEVSKTVAVTGSAYDPANVVTYERYTGDMVEGDYIICANAEVAMKNVISSNRFANESVTVANNVITNPPASIIWHIAPDGDHWTMYNAEVGKYAAGTNSNNQGNLLDEVSDLARWDITYSYSNYTVTNVGRSSSNNKYLRRNGDYGWATYANSTGNVPTFYKKVVTNQVATPTFSVAAGTFNQAQSVTISCETEGATIYYTTDGTTPTTESTVYTEAITIDQTMTLKAIAAKDGFENSYVATAVYTIIDLDHAGTEADPYTVADARTAIDANAGITDVYVTGIVTRNTYFNESNGTITYFISDDGTETNELEAYNGKGINGAKFTSQDDIQPGDVVVIRGNLTLYDNTTYEFSSGNYLVSLERKEVKYYLAGSWENGWTTGMVQLTKDGTSYATTKEITSGTTFKIVKVDETVSPETTTWYGGATNDDTYGIHSEWYEDIALTAGDGGKNFIINTAGEFTFTVDATDGDNLTLTVTGWPEPVWTLKGSFDSWGDGVTFTSQGDGTYKLTMAIEAGAEFKVVDENNQWYSAANTAITEENNSVELSTSNSSNMSIADAGTYTFTLNTNNGLTLTVTGWPISTDGNMFVKMTSGEVEDGAYLIVYEDGNLAFNGSLEGSGLSDSGNHIGVRIVNNRIVADETTKDFLFFIQNGSIKSASGYYIGRTSDSNGMDVDDETVYTNTISIDNDNNVVIKSSGNAYLRYNTSGNGMFRYYKSGTYTQQKAIQLYKLVTLPMNDIVITSAGWATYVPNQAVTIPEDVTAYIVTNATSTSVTLSSIASAPANTGLVVNGAQGTYTPTAAETTGDVSGNQLVVSDGTVKGDGATIYALGNKGGTVGFKRVANGVNVPAGKPYLTIESNGSKDFFDFSFDEGVATGIESVESVGFDMNAPVYDLQGRQVNRLYKGIFIQNGKKIIVK